MFPQVPIELHPLLKLLFGFFLSIAGIIGILLALFSLMLMISTEAPNLLFVALTIVGIFLIIIWIAGICLLVDRTSTCGLFVCCYIFFCEDSYLSLSSSSLP